MKRFLLMTAIGAALSLVAIAWASPALAEDCNYHTMRGTESQMDEPLEGFDVCFLSNVKGTLNGQFIFCYFLSDFWASDWIWADGDYDYWMAKGSYFLKTSKGEIFFDGRSVLDFARTLGTGHAEVTGGTGTYEGATGVLQFYYKWPNRLDLSVYEGQICTP